MAVASCTMRSTPGCEQPTTSTRPSGVRIASEISRNSSVPGLSDTSAIRYMPGTISMFLLNQLKVGGGPGLSHVYDFGWSAAVITLFRGQRRVLAIPRTAGLVIAVDPGSLLRRIDFDGRVHLEQVGQTA